jgi:hypothetical protein
MVDDCVPASELPIWQTHFEREPWGFNALDQLFSKNALHVAGAIGGIKEGVKVQDLMFSDRFENLQLDDDEVASLGEQERNYYLQKRLLKNFRELQLSQNEFDQLSDSEKRDYTKRHVAQMKKVLSNG